MPIGRDMTRIHLFSKLGLLEPLVRLARWSEGYGQPPAPARLASRPASVRRVPARSAVGYDVPARSR
jgi:hypothetical protein